jgi:transcriptional regulator with XRE-family HTH domain
MGNKGELAGRRIKLVRKVLSKTQEAMAEGLDVDTRTLRRWEAGELSSKGLEAVAAAVNLPAWYFYMPESDSDFERRLFAGLQALEKSQGNRVPRPVPSPNSKGLRQVTKIIYLLKALPDDDGAPLLLSYFSPDWHGMYLLPHANLPEAASKDIAYAEHMLAIRFGLSILDVSVSFDRDDPAMRSVRIKKTQDPVKAEKHGEYAQYNFFYAMAQISEPPKRLLAKYFKRGKLRYQWLSLEYLESFPDIKEHNADVLDFLQARFGRGLSPLPLAFEEVIRA